MGTESLDNSIYLAMTYAVENQRKELSKVAKKRGKAIVKLRNERWTFREIGEKFGFGETRAAKIYNKYK